MDRFMNAMLVSVVSMGVLGLSGCASDAGNASQTGGVTANGASGAKPAEEGITHQTTAEDAAMLASATPVRGNSAELWVNGMGCPQCVTNVDLALERLPGVESTRVDLGAGKVHVTFAGKGRPSPRQMAKAVDDAGNTLVKIVVN